MTLPPVLSSTTGHDDSTATDNEFDKNGKISFPNMMRAFNPLREWC